MDFINPLDNTPLARSAGTELMGLGDQIYSRLLRERIIFLAVSYRDWETDSAIVTGKQIGRAHV